MQYTVPFYTDAFEGFAHTHGFIRLRRNGLLIEYRTVDSFIGIAKTGIKKKEITFKEIVAIQYKANWFRTLMLLSTSSFEVAEAMGARGTLDVKLYVKRKHRKIAADFVEQAQIFLSEYQIKQLDLPDEDEFPQLNE